MFLMLGQPGLIGKISAYKLCVTYLQLVNKSYSEGKPMCVVNVIILKPSTWTDQ